MTDPDLLHFTPVPLHRRARGWSPEAQRAFIATLSHSGVVAHAARSVGCSPRSAYQLRRRVGAESFAAAWDWALEMGLDESRGAALSLARGETGRPMMRRGKPVGVKRGPDVRLLYAAMRALGAEQGGQRALMPHRQRMDLRAILRSLAENGPYTADEWAQLAPTLLRAAGIAPE